MNRNIVVLCLQGYVSFQFLPRLIAQKYFLSNNYIRSLAIGFIDATDLMTSYGKTVSTTQYS